MRPFVRNPGSLTAVLAVAIATFAPRIEAASLSLAAPEQVVAGWTRITGHYADAGTEPAFRAIARCGDSADTYVLPGIVHLAPAVGTVWLDVPGSPDRLVPAGTACEAPHVSVEMLDEGTVVASAPVSRREVTANDLLAKAPPAATRPARSLSLKGQKYSGAPFSKRTEAGVEWALDRRVSIQLNYERTTQAPMMPFDHDNGILTRLRVGF
jgi:hypothetical protein